MTEIRTEAAAVDAARAFVASRPFGADPVVTGPAQDHGWCWVVPWRTRASADAGQPMAPGAGPVIVVKADGAVAYLGSAPVATQLADIAAARGIG